MFPNYKWVKDKIKWEIKKYPQTNEMEIYQNFWDTAKNNMNSNKYLSKKKILNK